MKSQPERASTADRPVDDLVISVDALQSLMQDVLAKGATFQFRAKGSSMIPFIKDGDAITIAPPSLETPAVGKVVAFLRPGSGQLVVHRVIGRQGAGFLIQGDNSPHQPDGLALPQDILGCVTRVNRNGRRIYLGLGPERYLIAGLSRSGWLQRLVVRFWALKAFFRSSPE